MVGADNMPESLSACPVSSPCSAPITFLRGPILGEGVAEPALSPTQKNVLSFLGKIFLTMPLYCYCLSLSSGFSMGYVSRLPGSHAVQRIMPQTQLPSRPAAVCHLCSPTLGEARALLRRGICLVVVISQGHLKTPGPVELRTTEGHARVV